MVQAFKIKIENGQVDALTCLNYKCLRPVSGEKLRQMIPDSLFEKYERFKKAKALEADNLVRFCPKPGC